MASDDDFGPVERGGGRGRRRTASPAPSPHPRAAVRTADDDGFGPPTRGRGRRRLGRAGGGRRTLRVLLVTLLVVVLLLALTGVALALYASARITREPVSGLQDAPGGRSNVLVVGSDSREGLTEEELLALGTEEVQGRRTDTMFLLSFEGGRAAMLSLPRDLYVTRCDGTQGRINGAYNAGGPSCLVDTVTRLTGVPISGYLEVNFVGFLRLVNAVGGVSVFLEEPLQDAYAGIDLPAGCVHLDGTQALGFVRARHVDDDLGRIARQQRFIGELAAELASPATLLNVPRLFSVVGAGASSVIADQGFGVLDLLRLARAGRGLAGGGLATYTVPATPDTIGGAAVLVPAEGEAAALFAQFRDGSILHPPSSGDPSAVTPDQVTVTVLNGAGVSGLAAQGQQFLSERGFSVAGIGNAEPVDATVVLHPAGQADAAALVAAQVPGATAQESSDVDGVTLVLGPGADLSAPPAPAEPAPEEAPGQEQPSDEEPPPVGAGPVPEDC